MQHTKTHAHAVKALRVFLVILPVLIICVPGLLHTLKRLPVSRIIRLPLERFLNLLHRKYRVAKSMIRERTQIVPSRIAVRADNTVQRLIGIAVLFHINKVDRLPDVGTILRLCIWTWHFPRLSKAKQIVKIKTAKSTVTAIAT